MTFGVRTVNMTLVPMIDVLAVLRPAVDADLVLVQFQGGATQALSIRQIVTDDDLSIRLERDADGSARVTLHSSGSPVPTEAITSLRAVTFAAFVGTVSVGTT